MNRVDLFTLVHKGLRALVFDACAETARVDLTKSCAVDDLALRIERLIGFLDEHARLEDAEIVPAVKRVDPALAATLCAEHITHPAVHAAVERAARAVALAPDGERGVPGKHLLLTINQLASMHLAHMHHEETVVNAVLWGAYGDGELVTMRDRMVARISEARFTEWRAVLALAADPTERLVLARPVE